MKKLHFFSGIFVVGLVLAIASCTGGGGSTSGGSSSLGSFINCTSDDGCPANQGCQLDTPSGDGYCSPLCTDNAQCPAKLSCPEMVADKDGKGDCDDKGKHRDGLGACEQFERSRGPNTCASAPKGSDVVVVPLEAGAPLPPPDAG